MYALIIMGSLGLVIGLALAAASKIFYVYVDPKVEAVESALPGANCGGCGLPGCSANAEAIVEGSAAPTSCVAGGPDLAEAIAAILGVAVEAKEPDIARPGCTYSVEAAHLKYTYDGIDDCRAAALLGGGMKVCSIGCLGLGTCVRACPFNALVMGPEGLPMVIEEKCTGCGTCERACPKHIITLSSVTRRIMREYTTDECTTPCQRACPAGIDIREYIRQIALGEYSKAVRVIKERNPFPTVIGRICPRPCELECRRKYVDEPVAINYLKRFCADYEKESGTRVLPYKAPETHRKIAIVGGGVEGLSAAFFSARLGHSPVVFEALENCGGLLRSAIAAERLPMDILDWDIQGITQMGVRLETQKAMGRDFTLKSLFDQGFEICFTATGGWDSRLYRGSEAAHELPVPGTLLLIDFMRAPLEAATAVCKGRRVILSGGAKLALDTAKKCRQAGAGSVTVLLSESEIEAPLGQSELDALAAESVKIIYDATLMRLKGEADALTGATYRDTPSGELRELEAGTLLLASGRFPELLFSRIKPAVNQTGAIQTDTDALHWEAVAPYKAPMDHQKPGIMAAGDLLTDYSAAIKAIAAGRRGAVSIHKTLYDLPIDLPSDVLTPSSIIQNVDHVEDVAPAPRQIMPLCDNPALESCKELEKGFDLETAQAESERCLQCGLICYAHTNLPEQDDTDAGQDAQSAA